MTTPAWHAKEDTAQWNTVDSAHLVKEFYGPDSGKSGNGLDLFTLIFRWGPGIWLDGEDGIHVFLRVNVYISQIQGHGWGRGLKGRWPRLGGRE